MTIRTVTVKLRAEVAAYLAANKRAEKSTKELRQEVDRLDRASSALTKSGLITMATGLPGLLAPAGAMMASLPGLAFTAAGSFSALAISLNGVGDGFKAVNEGDPEALREALAGLSTEARRFIAEYERIKPTLDLIGDRTQDAFFREFNGSLETLTRVYLPTMLTQLPRVSAAAGRAGRELTSWAASPQVVAKVNRQLVLATDLTHEWTRFLRAGLDVTLDLADASADFNRDFAGGMADGAEAVRKWVTNARQTGQLNQVLANGQRIMSQLMQVTAKFGDLIFDIMANPALADGAVQLLNILGMTLDVVSALLTAFEALPPDVQSTVVTFAVLGGTALMVAGRLVALKAAMDSVRESTLVTGGAVKGVAGFLAGPWGIAITTAIALTGVWTMKQKQAKAAADSLRGTLDEQTGAITAATRQQVVNMLQQNGAIKRAKEYGLSLEEMTSTVLAGTDATNDYTGMLARMSKTRSGAEWENLIQNVSDVARAVDDAKTEFGDMNTAMGDTGKAMDATTLKTVEQTRALAKLADEIRAQSDPMFALIQAQQELRDAQADYNEAVKKYGPTSDQARNASIGLAKATVELNSAVAGAAGVMGDRLTPQMYATLRAAGLTERQISDIEKSFLDAAAAANAFAGDYGVHIKTAGLDAAIAKARTLRGLLGSFSAAANIGGGYVSGRRWGGITEHARWGTLREAQVYASVSTGARYAFAEPATRGEAFIPKVGNRDRSLATLDRAASWYGHTIAPAGGTVGGGGTRTIIHRIEHVHHIQISGKEQLSGWRRDIELSGGSVQNRLGSYRQ